MKLEVTKDVNRTTFGDLKIGVVFMEAGVAGCSIKTKEDTCVRITGAYTGVCSGMDLEVEVNELDAEVVVL